MRTFDDLIHEAAAADVSGWDFGWLDGRATEARPPWAYSLERLDAQIRAHGAFVAHSSRTLIEARRAPRRSQ
ncbi:MAG: hypothetical protein ACXVXC_15750 [Nocardioidaceae bacterium]